MDVVNTSERVFDANAIDPIGMQYTAEKQESKTAQSMASNETEECEKKVQWSELSSLPLEKIYSFLSRADQVNMSLVCRKWSEGYGSPSVWKTFTFALTESQLSMDTCPVMKFVQKYSNMFRHVKVHHIFILTKHLVKFWCRHFIVFLEILTNNSQLISVEFRGLYHPFVLIDNLTYDNIYRAIANFLGSQHHLKQVEFRGCFFRFHECAELLRKLTEKSRESLTHLALTRFVSDDPIPISTENIPTLADLPNLTTLKTDYTLIFENMVSRQHSALQTVKNCQTLALSKIILDYNYGMTQIKDLRGITSNDWRFLKMLCPNLQVALNIETNTATRREVEFFIVPNMPITRLEYRYDVRGEIMKTDFLFGHLLACKTNDHLVYLHLEWWCPVQDLASPLIPFLQTCQKLKYLKLSIIYPTNAVDLMEFWLDNPPEYLEKVLIYIWGIIDEEEYTTLRSLTSGYVYRLKLIGLNVKVKIDYEVDLG